MNEYNLVDIILSHIRSNNKRLYTSLPAVVNNFYPDKNAIDATILVSDTIGENNLISSGRVVNVPVQFPSGGTFKQGWSLAKGDNVLLNFTMRSLDDYHTSKGKKPVVMENKRYHDVSDCFATVGAFPKETPVVSPNYAGKTFIEDSNTAIVFNDNGRGLEVISDEDVVIDTTGVTRVKGDLIVDGNITANGGDVRAVPVKNVKSGISLSATASAVPVPPAPILFTTDPLDPPVPPP